MLERVKLSAVKCPNCHTESLSPTECHACGIVFAKFKPRSSPESQVVKHDEAEPESKPSRSNRYRPSSRRLIEMFLSISRCLKSGISLLETFRLVAGRAGGRHAQALEEIAGRLHEGQTLAEAAAHYPNIFSVQLVAEIGAAEHTGSLDVVFSRAVERLQLHRDAGRRLRSSHFRTAIILFLWCVVSPLPAVFMKGASYAHMAGSRLALIVAVFVGIPWLMVVTYRHTMLGDVVKRLAWRGLWPLSLLAHAFRSTFLATLGTQLNAGLSVVRALPSAGRCTTDDRLVAALETEVADGRLAHPLVDILQSHRLIDTIDAAQVVTGEASGTLADTFTRLGEHYRQRYSRALEQVVSFASVLITACVFAAIAYEIYQAYAAQRSALESTMELYKHELRGLFGL